MTKTQLFTNKSPHDDGAPHTPSSPRSKRRLPAWALPALLLLAFAGVFAAAFADRLLPAREVTVSPAVLLADIEPEQGESVPTAPTSTSSEPDYSAPMLFQAAGWFEPDPLPRRATALVDGVVDEVFVLEGETVTKGQRLAKLIDDDARLALDAAKRKLEQTVAEHHMHLTHIPAIEAEAASAEGKIESAGAKLAEVTDKHRRLLGLSKGTVSDQDLTAARSWRSIPRPRRSPRGAQTSPPSVPAWMASMCRAQVFDAMIAAARVQGRGSQTGARPHRDHLPRRRGGAWNSTRRRERRTLCCAWTTPIRRPIAVLFETGKLQARVDVPLADARGLAPGQAADRHQRLLAQYAEFKGVVSRIVGSADLQRNTLQAKVRVIDPDPRLRPEMLCRVRFLETRPAAGAPADPETGAPPPTGDSTRAVMAPMDALLDRAGGRATAWVVDAEWIARDEARTRSSVRLEVDGHVATRSGLLAGELLVLPPHDRLAEGRRIAPARRDPLATICEP